MRAPAAEVVRHAHSVPRGQPALPQVLLDANVTAIVQQGGSVRDAQVLAAVEAAGAAMLLTSRRHFRH